MTNGNPDICMVAYYHNLFSTNEEVKAVCEEWKAGNRGCVECKRQLANNIIEFLKPIREKRKYYEERTELVDKLLLDGTKKDQKKVEKSKKSC